MDALKYRAFERKQVAYLKGKESQNGYSFVPVFFVPLWKIRGFFVDEKNPHYNADFLGFVYGD